MSSAHDMAAHSGPRPNRWNSSRGLFVPLVQSGIARSARGRRLYMRGPIRIPLFSQGRYAGLAQRRISHSGGQVQRMMEVDGVAGVRGYAELWKYTAYRRPRLTRTVWTMRTPRLTWLADSRSRKGPRSFIRAIRMGGRHEILSEVPDPWVFSIYNDI